MSARDVGAGVEHDVEAGVEHDVEAGVDAPQVSVLLPVHNGENRVEAAIRSALDQTLRNIEVVAVDDGSTDRTPTILAELAADPRLRVLTLPTNRGLVPALNVGLAACRAPLVARLDADDLALPARLSQQVAAFARHGDTVLCATSYVRQRPDGSTIRIGEPPATHAALLLASLSGTRICHSTVLFDRLTALRCGGYDVDRFPAEDHDLWLRLLDHGRFVAVSTPLVHYLDGPGGISATRADEQRAQVRRRSRELVAHLVASEVDRLDPSALDALTGDVVPSRRASLRALRLLDDVASAIGRDLRRRNIAPDGLDAQHRVTALRVLRGRSTAERHLTAWPAAPGPMWRSRTGRRPDESH